MSRTEDGIYYFLGNITSHVLHALPLYKELGGTFVVCSKKAAEALAPYNLPVLVIDDQPYKWIKLGKRPKRYHEYTTLDSRLRKTYDYLNTHAKVVIFYELYDIERPDWLTNPTKVFFPHGNMLKNYFAMHPKRLESIKNYDYMAALGPYMKREFMRIGIEEKKLVDLGIARTDEVVHYQRKVVIPQSLKDIGVSGKKPIVSYLPTFWGESSVQQLGPKLLEVIPDTYDVLFRPHPQTPKKVLKNYQHLSSKPHIHFIPEVYGGKISLLDVLAASEVIIGDVSSVMLEAILLDKPLIFADAKVAHAQIDEVLSYSQHVSAQSVGQIPEIVNTAIKNGIDEKIWEQTKDQCFFHRSGDSVDSIVEFIRQVR